MHMGITDGAKASSSEKPPTVSVPTINVDGNGCGSGGALPQMVITSVEGIEEELALKDVNGIQSTGEQQTVESNVETMDHTTDMQSLPEQSDVHPSSEKVTSDDHQPQYDLKSADEKTVNGLDSTSIEKIETSESTSPHSTIEQEPSMIIKCEESQPGISEHIPDQSISTTKPSSQSAIQRPLRIENKEMQSPQPSVQQSYEDGCVIADTSKSVSQSASQRPLVFDAEASKKSQKSTTALPESIYEIIEPKECDDESNVITDSKEIVKSAEKGKEADSFFAKSKTFFKQDSKHKFTFPKFTFGSKELKESKGSKKHEMPKLENEDVKESKKKEYSLVDAATKEDTTVIEKYKKLSEDAIFAESSKPAKPEQQSISEPKQKAVNVPVSSRAALIHPVTIEPSSLSKMKAEEENFDLDHPKDKTIEEKRASTPESLYDTCCLKLATLIRNKAIEIATDASKSTAPKKPPKPTPDVLAKARAAVAARKLQEIEQRHLTFGENIPVGFSDIRYADDDTESSTDYKEVENFGVIMNPECYGIIRKMKMDEKLDSFKASSTCSGMTSYYTADSATLKGENSSDNTLETVSLGSSDSIVCRPPALPTESKDAMMSISKKEAKESDKVGHSSSAPTSSKRSAFASFFSFPSKRKVPPPIPPKPATSTKTSPEEEMHHVSRSNIKDVARCVNSLSLSPRPVHKTPPNDSAGIRKRPLTIIGVKDAEMILANKQSQVMNEPKNVDLMIKSAPVSLIRSDSPKPMRNLPIQPPSLSKPLAHPVRTTEMSPKPKDKSEPPPRPPPPIVSSLQRVASKPKKSAASTHDSLTRKITSPSLGPKPKIVPPVVQKPSPVRKAPHVPRKPSSKQLVSPPRPHPPAAKPNVPPNKPKGLPPARPPPPAAKPSLLANKSHTQNIDLSSQPDSGKLTPSQFQDIDIPFHKENSGKVLQEEVSTNVPENKPLVNREISFNEYSIKDSKPSTSQDLQSLKSNIITESGNAELRGSLHNFSVVLSTACDSERSHLTKTQPQPPPRIHRIRSRTVEIVPVSQKVPSLRRSQSLSDTDIEKRKETARIQSPSYQESKYIYTTVQKDATRMKNDLSTEDIGRRSPSVEGLSSRPLPPPPLPPRSKSRSSGRRSRSDERPPIKSIEENTNGMLSKSESMPDSLNGNTPLRPPSRKKKNVHKFSTIAGTHKDNTEKDKPQFYSLRLHKDTTFPPVRPERRAKQSFTDPVLFDENANVTAQFSAPSLQIVDSPVQNVSPHYAVPSGRPRGHSMGSGIPDSHSEQKNNVKYQRSISEMPPKKHSTSWYDEEIGKHIREGSLDDTWEKIDWLRDGTDYQNYKATPPRKKKQTSKFYVDVSQNAQLTSQLHSNNALQDSEKPIGNSNSGDADFMHGVSASEFNASLSTRTAPSPPPLAATPTADKETSPLPLSCSEKSVQTSLETLSLGGVSRGEASDDTDDLLDLAQTLQKELKTIITRHKVAEKSDEDSASTSEALEQSVSKNIGTLTLKQPKLPNSSTSSSSDLWQISSSDDSEDEAENLQDQSNLSEVSQAKKRKKIFYAAQEMMSSEKTFVDSLKLLNVDFRTFIVDMNSQKGSPVIPEEVLNQILNHLPQLQHLNENLLMELEDRIENWEKTQKIADVIVKVGPFLKLYSWFIQDFEANTALLEESKKKYPLFGQCVKEFEMSSRCKRLTLNHYMLRPVQRLPQYRLLLQQYLRHLPDDSVDHEDTLEALRIVHEVANHANESMRQGDNMQKLISIQNSIMGHREIIKPGRMFLKEGELMKLSRKGMQPRWFVLFNDLLLYLTSVQQGLYRINHELTLAGMKVAIPIQQDYQNEFSIISVTRSFTLAAKSPEERQEWIIALTKAIEENASKRSTFTTVRLQQKSQEAAEFFEDDGFVLGRKAPVWIPDARVTMCQLCTSEFTVTFRRHHCRACGKVICSICSSNRISLQYLGNRIARVCDECYSKLGPGSTACTESGETDSDNQQIAVKSHLRTDHWHHKKKRQLPSVLKEVCANDKGSTMSGYIHKRVNNKSWKRNWFVVKDKVLYEYRASEDIAALRSIPLLGFQINTFAEPFEGIDASLVFELSHPGRPPIYFHADTPGFAERWIKELRDATVLE